MLGEMSKREFVEWAAYYAVEPWGEERADVRSAIIASTVYAMQRGKRSKALGVNDFLAMPVEREAKPHNHMTPAKVALLKNFLGVGNAKAD